MKPLIDGDVLKYEIGFCGQEKDEGGNLLVKDFDFVAGLLDERIKYICESVDATEEPTLFLTADAFIVKELNKKAKREGRPPMKLQKNFREAMAVTKEYKGTRKEDKPVHYNNLIAYMLANYDCNVANGIEADDAMCIAQCKDIEHTIICSRDKDLRMCPGWHYSWECGKQASIGPEYTNHLGCLKKREDGKILGYGMMFFYYQMLVGDTVDNIPGVKGIGPVKAFKLLGEGETPTEEEAYYKVVGAYQEAFEDEWKTHIREMANLLWMVRELNDDGKPVLYKPYGS